VRQFNLLQVIQHQEIYRLQKAQTQAFL
jgi:hypothetical protein